MNSYEEIVRRKNRERQQQERAVNATLSSASDGVSPLSSSGSVASHESIQVAVSYGKPHPGVTKENSGYFGYDPKTGAPCRAGYGATPTTPTQQNINTQHQHQQSLGETRHLLPPVREGEHQVEAPTATARERDLADEIGACHVPEEIEEELEKETFWSRNVPWMITTLMSLDFYVLLVLGIALGQVVTDGLRQGVSGDEWKCRDYELQLAGWLVIAVALGWPLSQFITSIADATSFRTGFWVEAGAFHCCLMWFVIGSCLVFYPSSGMACIMNEKPRSSLYWTTLVLNLVFVVAFGTLIFLVLLLLAKQVFATLAHTLTPFKGFGFDCAGMVSRTCASVKRSLGNLVTCCGLFSKKAKKGSRGGDSDVDGLGDFSAQNLVGGPAGMMSDGLA